MITLESITHYLIGSFSDFDLSVTISMLNIRNHVILSANFSKMTKAWTCTITEIEVKILTHCGLLDYLKIWMPVVNIHWCPWNLEVLTFNF